MSKHRELENIKFIRLVKQHPTIWDVNDINYKKTVSKKREWEQIAFLMDYQGIKY